jgi:DNA-binding transcriptional regulator YdaS (Cro superfamily)
MPRTKPRPNVRSATSDRTMAHIRAHEGLSATIAKKLGIRPQAVSQWTEVPWNRVFVVAEVIGWPPHKIRPDIYPPPPDTDDVPQAARNRKVSVL